MDHDIVKHSTGEMGGRKHESPLFLEVAEGIGATPFIETERQQTVFERLRQRVERSRRPGTPSIIHNFVKHHFDIRFSIRQRRQAQSYRSRLYQDTETLPSDIQSMMHRGEQGIAEPGELLDVRHVAGMPDVELGRVTHPYGERLEDLEELRALTRQAILDRGGHVFSIDEHETFEVEDTDRHLTDAGIILAGLLVVRTRIVGIMPDQTEIRERSSFILRIDADSGFDQQKAAEIRRIQFTKETYIDDEMKKIIPVAAFAKELVEADNFDAAVPLSTTLFAFNMATKELVHQRELALLEHEQLPESFVQAIAEAREQFKNGKHTINQVDFSEIELQDY